MVVGCGQEVVVVGWLVAGVVAPPACVRAGEAADEELGHGLDGDGNPRGLNRPLGDCGEGAEGSNAYASTQLRAGKTTFRDCRALQSCERQLTTRENMRGVGVGEEVELPPLRMAASLVHVRPAAKAAEATALHKDLTGGVAASTEGILVYLPREPPLQGGARRALVEVDKGGMVPQ